MQIEHDIMHKIQNNRNMLKWNESNDFGGARVFCYLFAFIWATLSLSLSILPPSSLSLYLCFSLAEIRRPGIAEKVLQFRLPSHLQSI